MKTKLEDILNNLEESLIIGDQTFIGEVILNYYMQCSVFGTITFYAMDFKGVDFSASTFVNCQIQNDTTI